MNLTLLKDLRCFIDPTDADWAELLPGACLRYNTSRHSTTSMTPFKATFGAEAFEWDAELGLRELVDDSAVVDLPARMRRLHEELFCKTYTAREVAEKYYNKSVSEQKYSVDYCVLVFDKQGSLKKGRKLRVPWLGPYRGKAKVTDINYVLVSEANGGAVAREQDRSARRAAGRTAGRDGGRFPGHEVFSQHQRVPRERETEFEGEPVSSASKRMICPVVVAAYLSIVAERKREAAADEGDIAVGM